MDEKKIILTKEEIANADISEKKRTSEVEQFEKELAGTIVEVDGMKAVLTEKVTAQFCGDDIKKFTAERIADEKTVYLGTEVDNNFNAKAHVWGLIEGVHTKEIGFKDWLHFFKEMCDLSKDQPSKQTQAINNFFNGTNFNNEMKLFFINYAKNPTSVDMNNGIRIWLHHVLRNLDDRRITIKDDFIAGQIDIRTYNNMKDLIDKCESAIQLYQSGGMVF